MMLMLDCSCFEEELKLKKGHNHFKSLSKITDLMIRKKTFGKTLWKEENAFSPFPTLFSTHPKIKIIVLSCIYFVVCKCFEFGPV